MKRNKSHSPFFFTMNKKSAFRTCCLLCCALMASLHAYAQTTADSAASKRLSVKPEVSLRASGEVYYTSTYLTAGVRLGRNRVVGIGTGLGSASHDAYGATDHRAHLFLFHRHYVPLDRRQRIALYSDVMVGGSYIYKVDGWEPGVPSKGSVEWLTSWQPGLSIRLWGKSNIFLGPSFGPSIGLHAGLAL